MLSYLCKMGGLLNIRVPAALVARVPVRSLPSLHDVAACSCDCDSTRESPFVILVCRPSSVIHYPPFAGRQLPTASRRPPAELAASRNGLSRGRSVNALATRRRVRPA
ncbi:hypothetical protein [Natrialba taiwanensis]|uniref:hypothetical protein n=1 Tax=Natrialba taiwanensis TaxID=160846 RepID=UPI0012681EA5|nr:hypothetical protein [Natrialba taiwanensis]